jgi:hypothetical protein
VQNILNNKTFIASMLKIVINKKKHGHLRSGSYNTSYAVNISCCQEILGNPRTVSGSVFYLLSKFLFNLITISHHLCLYWMYSFMTSVLIFHLILQKFNFNNTFFSNLMFEIMTIKIITHFFFKLFFKRSQSLVVDRFYA